MSNWNQPTDPYQSDPSGQASANPYGQPSANPYGQPSADPYGQPAAGSYGTDAYGQPSADPYGQAQAGGYGADPYASAGPYGDPYAAQGAQAYGAYNPYAVPGALVPHPGAPFGVDPKTGLPYSSKTKLAAGLLQILLGGFGVGRFYTGHYGIAIAQIVVTWVTFGIGALWPLIDGIMMLTGDPKDSDGYPLRP